MDTGQASEAEIRLCTFCGRPILPGEGAVRRWQNGKLQPVEHASCGDRAFWRGLPPPE